MRELEACLVVNDLYGLKNVQNFPDCKAGSSFCSAFLEWCLYKFSKIELLIQKALLLLRWFLDPVNYRAKGPPGPSGTE